MDLSIRQLLNAQAALGVLFTRTLPAKLQYYVARNLAKIEAELAPYHETRRAMAEARGAEANPRLGRYEFPDDAAQTAFNEELAELQAETASVDLTLLKLEWLDGLELRGSHMAALVELIEA